MKKETKEKEINAEYYVLEDGFCSFCSVCGKNEWFDFSAFLDTCHLLASPMGNIGYRKYKDKFISFTKVDNHHNVDKYFCYFCFQFLVGLEKYYGKFFPELLDNEEAKKIVKAIIFDKKLFNTCLIIRNKGNFLPNDLISKIIVEKLE